jgi:putative oxidoreductase
MKFLNKFDKEIYGALRIVTALMFGFHGVQKMFNVMMGPYSVTFGTLPWFSGLIELVAGALILIGFQTRLSAFIASGEMAVAYIFFHWKFQFDHNFFPVANQGELAALYCFVFLYIAVRGAVIWGLDKK